MRSRWKGVYLENNLFSYFLNKKRFYRIKNLKTNYNNSTIVKKSINKTVPLHNGRELIEVIIKKGFLGYKFGEFINTTIFPKHTTKTKKKKK
jgi:ribosomal protein S19